MKVSTICVCRNAAQTIRFTLNSFLSQAYQAKELLIIDGLSSDETVAIARSYNSPLIKIFSGKDAGIYDAMNKGIELFTGDAAGFLNADDIYHDQFSISRIASALGKTPVAYGAINYVTAHQGGTLKRSWLPPLFESGAMNRGWMPPHPTVYARRSVFERVGKFDTSYKIAGDYDWLLRVFEIEKIPFTRIDEIQTDMQLGGISTAGIKSSLVNLCETARVRRKWLGHGFIDRGTIDKLLAGMQRKLQN